MTGPSRRPGSEQRISDRQRLILLLTTVAGHGLKHFLNAAFFVLLPEIKVGLGLSNVEVGFLSTARNIAGGIANLPAGFLADRFARRRAEILGVAIALIGAFAFLVGLATSFWFAALTASLMVAAVSLWHPAAISSLSRQFVTRRGLAISLHGTGGSVGEATGPVIAGLLLGLFSWRVLMQGSIVPAALFGFAIWAILRSVPTEANDTPSVARYFRSLRGVLKNRGLLLILVFAGGFAGSQSVMLTFLPIHLREDQGVSAAVLGLYLGLAQIAGIASQPLMGYLSDRWGRKRILVPALAVLGVSFLSLALVPPGPAFIATMFVMGAFLFPLMSILLAAAMDLVEGDVQATTVSLVFGVATAVAGIAPAVAGGLADAAGLESTFLFASGLTLATAAIALVSRWEVARI
ncbi:MAG: MFS transporter [Chloroflexi bacterium]|nr:MFS transporter [Chloroflexota bacterium]